MTTASSTPDVSPHGDVVNAAGLHSPDLAGGLSGPTKNASPTPTLQEQLAVAEDLTDLLFRRRSEVLRTGIPDAGIDEARETLVALVDEVVAGWVGLGEPAELQERVLALPEAQRLRVQLREDPATTMSFMSLTGVAGVRSKTDPSNAVADIFVPSAWDDASVAQSLADHLRGRWLYVATWRRWLRWDGRRWAADESEHIHEEARRWIVRLGAGLFEQGAGSHEIHRCAAYRSRARLEAVVTMARRIDGIAEVPRAFDAHLDLLCVANGVVDLRTGNLGRHDPTLRLTKLSDVAYRPAAAHPDVTALLQVVSDETRPWLRRLAGYAATGHASEDVVAVFDGGGANGKTTLLEALGAVLGDYGGAVSPQLVMRTRHEPHPTIKADLLGKRLVWISETEEGGVFRMEQVKALTGGDQISARFMRGDFFTFQPTHTLVIATNHRPSVGSTEYAAWRRLRLVTFPYTYRPDGVSRATERMQDRGLRHRVTTGTAQREALLAWLVAGAIDWYREGLGGCQEIEEATSAWRASEDVIMRFAGDCLQFGPDYSVGGAALYDAYKKWCQNEHRPPLSNRDFAQQFLVHDRVVTAGVTKARPKGVTQYRGVDLRVLGS